MHFKIEKCKNLLDFLQHLSRIFYFYFMIESILLGLLQGLAEFLPISSSGHLVLGKYFLNMQDAGMFFDIMLHAGTLLSIFVVFRKKIINTFLTIKNKNE